MPAWPFTFPGAAPAPAMNVLDDDMPTGATEIQAGTLYLLGLTFCNASGAPRRVTVQDTAGVKVLFEVEIPVDGVDFTRNYMMKPMIGLRWHANGAGVSGHAWGY